MPRIAGIDLPDNKRTEISLTYIFGIGRSNVMPILKQANVDELKKSILALPEVQEIDMRASAIQKSLAFNKNLDNILLYGLAGIGIFGVILIYNLTSFGIKARKKDVGTLTHIGVSNNFIRFTYFLEGIFLIGLASMAGFLIFLKLYDFILQGINLLNTNAIIRSSRGELETLFIISFISGIIITAIVNFSSTRKYLKFYKR